MEMESGGWGGGAGGGVRGQHVDHRPRFIKSGGRPTVSHPIPSVRTVR